MKWDEVGDTACPIARTLSVVGDRWTMLILRNAFMRMRRFDDFQRALGVPKHILSVRLKKLVEAGVMVRKPYQEAPVRCEYVLTASGKDLYPIVMAMAAWGNRWMTDDGSPLTAYVHRDCGKPFTPVLACSECGEEVVPQKVLLAFPPKLPPAAATATATATARKTSC